MIAAIGVALAIAAVDPGAVRQLQAAAERYAEVSDYQCRFGKQERLDGRLQPREEILLEFKKPFSVRMRWVGKVHKGREATYVEGKNQDRIRGRQGGLLKVFAVNLAPRGKTAMRGNRHPITEAGLGHVIEVIGRDLARGAERGEVEVSLSPDEAIELRFHGDGYYARRQRIWIDRGLGLPARIEVYGPDAELLERYEYTEVRINLGLTDRDFEP